MKTYTPVELKKILAEHAKWLADSSTGSRADLQHADLQYANLQYANLQGANLRSADPRSADLQGVNLKDCELPAFQICPQKGKFIAYKKVRGGTILELEIIGRCTSSLVGRKCRTAKVKVLRAIDSRQKSFVSLHDETFKYRVGKVKTEPDYDDDIREECKEGIHFFMTLEEAKAF